MPASVDKVGWATFRKHSGPIYHGSLKHELPLAPSEKDRWLAVTAAAEGGRYDSVNMYDAGLASVGLIQWTEWSSHMLAQLLGYVTESTGDANIVGAAFEPVRRAFGASIKKNTTGSWQFFANDKEASTEADLKALMYGCSGETESWTPEAKARAKLWAVCLANVWNDPRARAAQERFTKERLGWFTMKDAKLILADAPDTAWANATVAIFTSFAVNSPVRARDNLKAAWISLGALNILEKWSPEWCKGVIKQLTVVPGIPFYEARYNNLRPMVHTLYGVDLPKTFKELSEWQAPQPPVVITIDNEKGPEPQAAEPPSQPAEVTQGVTSEPWWVKLGKAIATFFGKKV